MPSGKIALIIPKTLTDRESSSLSTKLKRRRISVLGKTKVAVAVGFNDKVMDTVLQGRVPAQDIWVDTLSSRRINQLPNTLKHLAHFWNEYLEQGDRGVNKAAMNRTLRKVGLEIRQDKVFDVKRNKKVGDIKEKKGSDKRGNWTLSQEWNWYFIPLIVFPGIYVGHYADVGLTSKTSVVAGSITARISAPHQYSYMHNSNTKIVAAHAIGFIPFWEVTNRCTLTSTASYSGGNKNINTTLTV